MQINSIIFFYGTKETDDDEQLVIRLVLVESFIRPLIVVPDFDPTFYNNTSGLTVEHWVESQERRNSVIVVRPRDHWHLAFLALANKHYS
jgi:hypothetical protein